MSLPLRRAVMRVAIAAAIVASGVAGGAGEVRAQVSPKVEAGAPAALPEPLTREALRDLLARLSDAEVRELLIAQLDKEIATAPAATADGYIDNIEAEAATLRESWRRMFAATPALPTVPVFLANQLIGERDASVLLLILPGIYLFVRWYFVKDRSWEPYLGGGVAYISGEVDTSGDNNDVEFDDSTVGYWVNGGIKWVIGEHFNLGGDVRWQRLSTEDPGTHPHVLGRTVSRKRASR